MESMNKMARSRRKTNSLTVDFSGVETLGRFHEDGDYRLRVVEVTQEDGDKYPYLNWCLESVDDPEGARVYNNTSLAPQSLWNVKAMLEAIGVEVPDSEFDLDLDEYVDLELMGKVEMEPYEGKSRPRLADFWPVEDEKDSKKPSRSRRSAKDDDDEKPARGGKRGSKKVAVTEEAIGEMNQEELEDLIENAKLDVDLADFRTLRKMQAAVVDAAQEAGIIEEGEDDEGGDKNEGEDDRPSRRGSSRSRRGAKDNDEEDEKPARSRRSSAKDEDEDEAPARRSRRSRR